MWGAAFSAHQTEGVAGGGEAGDWWAFENPPDGRSPIANGDTTQIAVDHWNRYDEDYAIAQKIGLNTVRISIAWEKVEPEPGVFSDEAIQHYREELMSMRAHGLIPMVALQHFTHPLWFQEHGSWVAPDSPWLFLQYARYVVTRLQDLCDLWITMNEPMVIVNEGFISGKIPPRIHNIGAAVDAAFNLIRAHRLVTAMIHDIQPPHDLGPQHPLRGVGLVNSLPLYAGARAGSGVDAWAASVTDEVANWLFLDGAVYGGFGLDNLPDPPNFFIRLLWDPLIGLLEGGANQALDRQDPVPEDIEAPHGSQKLDWLGVNYYTRYRIELSWTHLFDATSDGPVRGDNGWEVYPPGLEIVLRKAAARYDVPLVVSETGVADRTDLIRQQYIRDSLVQTDRAIFGSEQGPPLDIRGYYHWSLMDNFEWLGGYQYRFGLTEIRYDDGLRRVIRPSAWIYRDEIRKRMGGGR